MSTSKSGGCGCGGAGCDCGTGMCTDESFKRPRFFAGQLLTEDDLQAMIDYVVGKNRLHNRYLFGDGVVCGLTVTCHPCGGGSVMVAPGFALDCCGNDLLLPCAEEVDIRALLRDLRKRQLEGYECGDPCEKDGERRHYGLYLAYKETPADPVAPYNSGDPCGQQGCEPTRICEGYGFELRCECTVERQADLYARIFACIGDVKSATSAIEMASNLYGRAMAVRGATGTSTAEIEAARQDAVLLKTWLLSRLEQAGSRTRCDLYDRVKGVVLTQAEPDRLGNEREAAEAEAGRWLELVQVLLEYFIDCVCLALNPPCGACDDTALLLACIELDGCDVVDICNMSRRFVLSPAAMRYWLPVNLIGDLAETFCCDLDLSPLFEKEQGQTPPPPTPDRASAAPATATAAAPMTAAARATAAAPAAAAAAVDTVAMPSRSRTSRVGENARIVLERVGIRSEGAVDAAEFSAGLAGLALRVGRVDTGELRHRAGAVGDDIVKRLQPVAASVIETPEVRNTVNAMVKEEVAAGRDAVVAELREAPEVRNTVNAMVKEEVAAGRDAVVAELREQIATSTEAAVGALATSVSAEADARLSKDTAKVAGDVERRVSEAVSKELAVTRLNGAVENLAVVKALRKENDKLRADLGKLSDAVKKLGGRG